ncbi:MAG: YtxH domain-containing protein [Bryobacteraceae bacterium]|jgi:gas vesicle protein
MSKKREDEDTVDDPEDAGVSKLGWFITGAAIGAGIALLYAPKSGKDTRRYISNQTEKGRQMVTDTSKEVADASREMFERGRKLVEDAADLFERGRKLVRG